MSASSSNARGVGFGVCIAVVLLSASMSSQATPPPTQAGEPIPLVFVVNRKNPVQTLSLTDVRMMLLGERSYWPNGNRVTVVMREPEQPERDAIIRLVCRMNDRDYMRAVLRAVFTGELQSVPKLLGTPIGVIRFVYNVPGAIGYVLASEVDETVKIVRLSGAPAGAAFGFTLQTR
jgi:ABC-type phosphate transport system substrate-binding protein